MKILVTGSNGFIGKNLIVRLNSFDSYEIISYDKEDDFSKIEENISSIDFIFHLAGVNRPTDVTEFYKGNVDLTNSLIQLIEEKKLNIPILITSSIQATNDTDYGKSKKIAEDLLIEYGKDHESYVFRLPNVFGKWCRPNYNSAIATFCNNITKNEGITVNDPDVQLNLVYIDDVVEELINVLNTKKPSNKYGDYCSVPITYTKRLGDIVDMLYSFKEIIKTINVPQTGDEFTKKLFSTYLSYLDFDDLIYTPKTNVDNRGSFTELVRTPLYGQMSVTITKPGISRGHHYHHTKTEKFIVVKGKGKLGFKHSLTGEEKEFIVSGDNPQIVNIPVGYSHYIENIGEDDMVMIIWCNELFDQNKPDTYAMN